MFLTNGVWRFCKLVLGGSINEANWGALYEVLPISSKVNQILYYCWKKDKIHKVDGGREYQDNIIYSFI
jgi:hypothetical protein